MRLVPVLCVAAGLLVGALGILVFGERQGLAVQYFANTPQWQGSPTFKDVGEPQVIGRRSVAGVLVSQEIFSLRWRGWIVIGQSGKYAFAVSADEMAYLRLDGQEIVATVGTGDEGRESGLVSLDEGAHFIEVGMSQTGGKSRLETTWAPPDGDLERLPAEILFSRRAGALRQGLRGALTSLGVPQRRWVGAALVLVGFVLLRTGVRPFETTGSRLASSITRRLRQTRGRAVVEVAFLLALFILSYMVILPFTGATVDGDDVRYLDSAMFDKKMGWNVTRYVHIYLLRGFIWLQDGRAFSASRIYWASMFALTMVSIAVGVSSMGTGLQVRTLAVASFLLVSQSTLFRSVGAAFADYSAMALVTVAVAVALHGVRVEWKPWTWLHPLLLGALAVAAVRAKETGFIVFWLPILFLWSRGRIDIGGFFRRLGSWLLGVLGASLLLMALDARYLGDFWFGFRPSTMSVMRRFTVAIENRWDVSRFIWLEVIWETESLRYLALLALVAAVASWILRQRIEWRILCLTPLVYLFVMIVVHPPIPFPRYLFPIVPMACLMGAGLLRELGIEKLTWSTLFKPRHVVMVVCLLAFFGAGFGRTRLMLAKHLGVQTGDLILYPWRVFAEEIEAERPRTIGVSGRLYRRYQMAGQHRTRERIARMFFRRGHLRVRPVGQSRPVGDIAVGTRRDFNRWRRSVPGLEETAIVDPSGQVVLVRPRAADDLLQMPPTHEECWLDLPVLAGTPGRHAGQAETAKAARDRIPPRWEFP